jgi:hypothetical protein
LAWLGSAWLGSGCPSQPCSPSYLACPKCIPMCGAAHSSHIHTTSLGDSIHCRFRFATPRVSPFHSIPVCGLRDLPTLRSCHVLCPALPVPIVDLHSLPPANSHTHAPISNPAALLSFSPLPACPSWIPHPPPFAHLFNAPNATSLRNPIHRPSQSGQPTCTRPHNRVPLTRNSILLSVQF